MEKQQQTEDIRAIREMMEKSTKFLSLSGLSGVVIGLVALAGAAFAWFYLLRDPAMTDYTRRQEALILLADALVVLAVSVGVGFIMARRKARRIGQPLLNKATYKILYAMAPPLVGGGVFCLIVFMWIDLRLAISATLLFYGLSLVAASQYTYGEIRWLGVTEIVLGLVSALLLNQKGLLFWSLGFGVCHVVYGLVMYLKYDRKNDGRVDFGTE